MIVIKKLLFFWLASLITGQIVQACSFVCLSGEPPRDTPACVRELVAEINELHDHCNRFNLGIFAQPEPYKKDEGPGYFPTFTAEMDRLHTNIAEQLDRLPAEMQHDCLVQGVMKHYLVCTYPVLVKSLPGMHMYASHQLLARKVMRVHYGACCLLYTINPRQQIQDYRKGLRLVPLIDGLAAFKCDDGTLKTADKFFADSEDLAPQKYFENWYGPAPLAGAERGRGAGAALGIVYDYSEEEEESSDDE